MLILGLNKTTLLDYPGELAATVFLGGCNFRCPYCHNRDLVLSPSSLAPYSPEEILAFLSKRRGILGNICISGGEPTINPDLPEFLESIKVLGYSIKLDTNGSNPDMLKLLKDERLIDYCAMDIKNSPEKYPPTIGLAELSDNAKAQGSCSTLLPSIMHSADILLSNTDSSFLYEFRTTVVCELHSKNDIRAISKWLSGAKAYFLQAYSDNENVIKRGFHSYTEEELRSFAAICREYIPNTYLRGI